MLKFFKQLMELPTIVSTVIVGTAIVGTAIVGTAIVGTAIVATVFVRPAIRVLQAFGISLALALLLSSTLALAAPQKILLIGDSLSSAHKIPKEKGWVHLLNEKVKPKWHVINGAISGATTAQGLNLLPKLLKTHQPNIVIIALGGNDGLQGKPIPYITSNLDKLIKLSKASGAKIVLLGIRLPPNFGPKYTQPFFNQYAKLARKYTIAYVPFLLEGIGGNPSLMMPDGIHPSAAAQAKILKNVWPMIEKQL